MFGFQWALENFAQTCKHANSLQNKKNNLRLWEKSIQRCRKLGWSTLPQIAKNLQIPRQIKYRGFAWVTQYDTKIHSTVQSGRQIYLASGQCSRWSCSFCFVKYIVRIYGINTLYHFTEVQFWHTSVGARLLIKKLLNTWGNVSDHNNSEKKCEVVWEKPVP